MVKFYCDICGTEYPAESAGYGKLTIDITCSVCPPAQKFINPKHLESRL